VSTQASNAPKTLFRFRPLDAHLLGREVDALKGSYLWSPKFTELNDPMEAFYEIGDPSDDFFEVIVPDFKVQLERIYQQFRDMLSSWCLISFAESLANYPMWAYYASNFAGMCLEFDRELLEVGDLRRERIVHVEYANTPLPRVAFHSLNDISLDWAIRYLSRKREEWTHEHEWRYITGTGGPKHYLDDALRRVYIGPRADPKSVEAIAHALKGRPVEILQGSVSGLDMKFNTIQSATEWTFSDRVVPCEFDADKILGFVEPDLRQFLRVPYEELLQECQRTALHPNAEGILSVDIAHSDSELLYFWTQYRLRSGREVHDKRYFDRSMNLVSREMAKP
jgi:hypothetical protein